MSSIAGRLGYPYRLAYSTSKWGLIGFTKTLSMELGADNIRVNAILPVQSMVIGFNAYYRLVPM